MTATPNIPAAAPKAKTPCACSRYSVLVNLREQENGDLTWDQELTTGCPGTLTGREFAPGHDAKLKGFLIRAGIAGHEVTENTGGMAVTGSAIAMASRYGFEYMVRQGIAGGLIKAETKRMKKGDPDALARGHAAQAKVDALTHDGNEVRKSRELAALVAAEEEKFAAEQAASRPEPMWDDEPEPQIVKAKVGRWVYEGTEEGGEFTYTDKKGEVQTTTKYTLI